MDTVPDTEVITESLVDYVSQAAFDLCMHTGLSVNAITLSSVYVLPRYMLFSGIPESTEFFSLASSTLRNTLVGFVGQVIDDF